jgi:hypothetical protein
MTPLADLEIIGDRNLYLIEWLDALNAAMLLVMEAEQSDRPFPGSERGSLDTWDGVQGNLMAICGKIHDHIEALKQVPGAREKAAAERAETVRFLVRMGFGVQEKT